MGNFLATPITEKDTDTGKGNGLEYGISCMQGWRTNMEDSHVASVDPKGLPKGSTVFAVFDGHGGQLAATLAADKLTAAFAKRMKEGVFSDAGSATSADPTVIGEAMRDSFMAIDKDLEHSFEADYGSDQSGCTAISAFVTASHIIVANSGDSRSVLAKDGRTVEMSYDHKPINPTERARIQGAGGVVRSNRVNGDLAVSRALGDFSYKANKSKEAKEQQVSAEPDIKIEKIDGTEEFLVLACDGIWDVMSNDELCAYVRQLMNSGESDLGLIAEEVLDYCLRAGSRDNMSVVLVKFPAAKIGKGGGVAKIREERKRLEETEAAAAQSEAHGADGNFGGALAPAKST